MKAIFRIIFLTALLSGFVYSQTATVTAPKITITNGDTLVTIPIYVTNFNGLNAVSIRIKYTDSVLSWRGASNWGTASGTTNLALAQDGVLTIGIISIAQINIGSTKLADLTFRYNGGWTNLVFDTVASSLNDAKSNKINAGFSNGFVRPQGFKVSGSVLYNNSTNTPLSGVSIFLKNGDALLDSAVTDNSGNYSFSAVPNGTYSLQTACYKNWGGVTSTDALIMRRYIASLITLDDLFVKAADVNGSGTVSSTDALIVRRRITSAISSFSIPDWVFSSPSTVSINNADVILNFKGVCAGDVNGSNTLSN
jgi:hypothetical protein